MPSHESQRLRELKRVAPFLAAALIAFVTVALPPKPEWNEIGPAMGLFVVMCMVAAVLPRARLPHTGGAVLALIYFVVIALLRDGQGGANAGYAPLTMLPVFWLALFGRRRHLFAAIVCLAVTFFGPLLLIGGEEYTPTEFRRGILFTVTAALIGITVQSLVARMRATARDLEAQRDLANASEVAAREAEHVSREAERIARDAEQVARESAAMARRSEEALRDSEDRMRSLIDHLPDTVVLILDRDLRCTHAQGQMLRRAEFEGREFVGAYILEGADPDKMPLLLELYGTALEGQTHRFEYVSPSTGFSYETELAPYREGGEITGVLSVSRDITARRRAEAEVAAAQKRFVESFQSAPIGMALVALDGAVTAANPALGELLGRDAGALIGMKAEDVLENRDPEVVRARYAQIAGLATGELTQFTADERYVHADGHIVDVAVSISLVRDVDGNPSHCITQILDITERKRLQAQLQHLAEHDPLTGLFNRREFSIALGRHVDAVARGAVPGAAILLDVDRFKSINDTYGHAAGDRVLCEVGAVIERSVRAGDIVARLGGDEFAILLPEADAAAAEAVAQRLVSDARTGVRADGTPASTAITLSVGVALLSGQAITPDELLEEADRAMYRAKQAGRDGYAVSSLRVA